jgi:hypothetical protein
MFPWESTDTGEETTPQWSDVQPDGSRIRIWTGDSEQHISTDIAYAVFQYWKWTGENDFFTQYGAELILDTAVFWGSRVEQREGRYEISQQIGPDEYHENIETAYSSTGWWSGICKRRSSCWTAEAERAAGRRTPDRALDLSPERLITGGTSSSGCTSL